MKKILCFTTLLAIIGLNTGCATYMAKKHWNEAQEAQAVRVEADGNQVMVGVDLTAMTYLKDNWQWAVPAAILDAGLIYGAYVAYDEITDDGGNTTVNQDPAQAGSEASGGRDGTAITVVGDGNNVQVRGDETNFAGE